MATQMEKDSINSETDNGTELVSLEFQASPVIDVGIPPAGSIKVMFKLPHQYNRYCNASSYTVHVMQSQQLAPSLLVEQQPCSKLGKLITVSVTNQDDRLYRSVIRGYTLDVHVVKSKAPQNGAGVEAAPVKLNLYVLGEANAAMLVEAMSKSCGFTKYFEVVHLSSTYDYNHSKLQALQEQDMLLVMIAEYDVLDLYIQRYEGKCHLAENSRLPICKEYFCERWTPLLSNLMDCKAKIFISTLVITDIKCCFEHTDFVEFILTQNLARVMLKKFFTEFATVVDHQKLLATIRFKNAKPMAFIENGSVCFTPNYFNHLTRGFHKLIYNANKK